MYQLLHTLLPHSVFIIEKKHKAFGATRKICIFAFFTMGMYYNGIIDDIMIPIILTFEDRAPVTFHNLRSILHSHLERFYSMVMWLSDLRQPRKTIVSSPQFALQYPFRNLLSNVRNLNPNKRGTYLIVRNICLPLSNISVDRYYCIFVNDRIWCLRESNWFDNSD